MTKNDSVTSYFGDGRLNAYFPLHKKLSFPLEISSVNVTKSAGNCGFGQIY